MKRQVGWWAVVVLLVVGVACGGSGEEEGDAEVTVPDTAGDASDGCLLDERSVGAALGGPVAATGPVAGGSGGDAGRGEYGMSWQGCAYEGPDGATVTIAELVDEEGEADVSGFDQLAAAVEDGPALGGLGDEVFADGPEVVARAGGVTLLLGFGAGAEPTAGDLTDLAEVGADVVALGTTDMARVCPEVPGLVPEQWDEVGEPVVGTGDGLAAGLEYTYDRCTVPVLDGDAELNVGIAGAEVYDARVRAEAPPDDVPLAVPEVGDDAVAFGDRVYVRVEARAAMVEGETAEGRPLDGPTLATLARATASELE